MRRHIAVAKKLLATGGEPEELHIGAALQLLQVVGGLLWLSLLQQRHGGLVVKFDCVRGQRTPAGQDTFRGALGQHEGQSQEERLGYPEGKENLEENAPHGRLFAARRGINIPHSAYRFDALPSFSILAQLLAQLAYVHVNAAVVRGKQAAQGDLRQFVACDHAPGFAQQHVKQIELHGRQIYRFTAAQHGAGGGIELHVAHANAGLRRLLFRSFSPRAPQDGTDARHQFTRVERLRQVIIGAQFQAHDAVHVLPASGEQQHRNGGGSAQFAQHVETIHARKHDVEYHQRVLPRKRPLQPTVAVVHSLYLQSLRLEKLLHQLAQLHVIVHYQHAVHWPHICSTTSRLARNVKKCKPFFTKIYRF